MFKIIRDALIIVAVAAVLSLVVNAIRPSGSIALVADKPYEVLVPCPEYHGPVQKISPKDFNPREVGLLIIDARLGADYQVWHVDQAINLPFDYLEPVSKEAAKKLMQTRAKRLVIYGDGGNPDTGEQLAKELTGQGLINIVYVEGGAPALRPNPAGAP